MSIPPRKVSFFELGDNKFRDFFRQWVFILLDFGRDFLNCQYAESLALRVGVDLDCTAGRGAAGGIGDGNAAGGFGGGNAAGGFGDTDRPEWIGLDAIKGFREGKGNRDDCSIKLLDCDGRILIVCRRTPFNVCRCSGSRLCRSIFVVAPGELKS